MKVLIDLTDTSGFAPDLGYKITFEAKSLMGSATVPGRVITPSPVVVELEHGKGEVSLEPGTHICMIRAGNYRDSKPITFDVPEKPDEMTFRELLEGQFVYEPSVVLEAQQYMIQSRQWALKAETAADRIGTAEAVIQARDDALTAQGMAETAQQASEEAAMHASDDRAATLADRKLAETARQGAETAQQAAEDAQHTAEERAAFATTEANRATEAEEASETARADAQAAKQAAETAESGAQDAQHSAEGARDSAQGHATSAADSCSAAQDAALNAANDVRDELSTLKGATITAANSAQASASAASDSAAAAHQSELNAAAVVSDGVADATTSIKGKLMLSGDLGGTADSPTVPGLSTKAPLSHTHQIGDIDGLQDTVNKVSQATYNATPDKIVKRGADGTIAVAPPTGSQHAATKGYVDGGEYATSTTGRETVANKIVRTWSDGYVHINGAPTATTHAAPKSYVDARTPQVLIVDALPASPDPSIVYMVKE